MDEDPPHGSSHRWPLIAETRELASAINSASHAASTVGRKGDCKGSLVTEHSVTQVYVAAPRVLPASPFVPVSREGYTRLPPSLPPFGVLPIRSFSSREYRDPPGDNQEQTPLCSHRRRLRHASTFLSKEFNSVQRSSLILRIRWMYTSFKDRFYLLKCRFCN